jgi:hypothetical protein
MIKLHRENHMCGLRFPWNLFGESHEHEGKALTALLVEGATRAPVIGIFTAQKVLRVADFEKTSAKLQGNFFQKWLMARMVIVACVLQNLPRGNLLS